MFRTVVRWSLLLGLVPLIGMVVFRIVLLLILLVAAIVLSFEDREIDELPNLVLVAEGVSLVLAVVAMMWTWRVVDRRPDGDHDGDGGDEGTGDEPRVEPPEGGGDPAREPGRTGTRDLGGELE